MQCTLVQNYFRFFCYAATVGPAYGWEWNLSIKFPEKGVFFSSHSCLEVGDHTVSSVLVSSCICELTVKEVCFWKRKHYVIAKKQGSLMERAVPVNSAETPWVLRERCRILVRTYWPDNGPKTNKAVIKSKIWMEKNYREFRRISVRVRHLF